jgi:hypothetical protein
MEAVRGRDPSETTILSVDKNGRQWPSSIEPTWFGPSQDGSHHGGGLSFRAPE